MTHVEFLFELCDYYGEAPMIAGGKPNPKVSYLKRWLIENVKEEVLQDLLKTIFENFRADFVKFPTIAHVKVCFQARGSNSTSRNMITEKLF